MFSVIFEVCPKDDQWDAYLGHARLLRPELERVDGFIDNVRYASVRRPGWVLSHSTWRDEKALIRWRTLAVHHDVQRTARAQVFRDYHLRVGEITADTHVPPGHALREQRLDETETGAAKSVSIVEWRALPDVPDAGGLVDWDAFDAIATPGDRLLLLSWRDEALAEAGERRLQLPAEARLRRVRIVRDYGMFDRREAPQYHPAQPDSFSAARE